VALLLGFGRRLRGIGRWWWRRTRWIQPTRDGWWCVFAAIGLGVAGLNTGNNLAYLLCAMLLALIMASGLLSDVTLRGLRVTLRLPPAFHAGQAALVAVLLANGKRRLPSYSVVLEAMDLPPAPARGWVGRHRARLAAWLAGLGFGERRRIGAPRRLAYAARLPAGAERVVTWELVLPARGRRRLPRLRAATRFPFGLFVKSGPPLLIDEEVIVYPAVHPVTLRALEAGSGEASARRRGRGHDLHNLRAYAPGDEPHLIHWRTSARSGTLIVRELEEDTTEDARIVLVGTGAAHSGRLEAALSEAASLAVHLLRRGAAVELAGTAGPVPLARGGEQERRILMALALYAPAAAREAGAGAAAAAARGAPLREFRVSLDGV
jgi:uncharacterized protein (DUF58 family)